MSHDIPRKEIEDAARRLTAWCSLPMLDLVLKTARCNECDGPVIIERDGPLVFAVISHDEGCPAADDRAELDAWNARNNAAMERLIRRAAG